MSRTLSQSTNLFLALAVGLFVCLFLPVQAGAASSSPLSPLMLSFGEVDGFCDEWESESDPDCGEFTEEEGEPAEECEYWDDTCVGEEEPEEGEEPEEEEVIQWPAPPKGSYAKIKQGSRRASIPRGAPKPVRQMIRAANRLVNKPYKWGGGHRRWEDRGYDCSGAVSYVLRAGGYLSWPLASGGLAKWGKKGAGKWVRVYANKNHVFMVIAGLRFDTTAWGARGGKGPRWRDTVRPTGGFKLRHPAGL